MDSDGIPRQPPDLPRLRAEAPARQAAPTIERRPAEVEPGKGVLPQRFAAGAAFGAAILGGTRRGRFPLSDPQRLRVRVAVEQGAVALAWLLAGPGAGGSARCLHLRLGAQSPRGVGVMARDRGGTAGFQGTRRQARPSAAVDYFGGRAASHESGNPPPAERAHSGRSPK